MPKKKSRRTVEKPTIDCPVCLEIFHEPVRTPCGHVFCFFCVIDAEVCPLRRASLGGCDLEPCDQTKLLMRIHIHPRALGLRDREMSQRGFPSMESVLAMRKSSSKPSMLKVMDVLRHTDDSQLMISRNGFMVRNAPSLVAVNGISTSKTKLRLPEMRAQHSPRNFQGDSDDDDVFLQCRQRIKAPLIPDSLPAIGVPQEKKTKRRNRSIKL